MSWCFLSVMVFFECHGVFRVMSDRCYIQIKSTELSDIRSTETVVLAQIILFYIKLNSQEIQWSALKISLKLL